MVQHVHCVKRQMTQPLELVRGDPHQGGSLMVIQRAKEVMALLCTEGAPKVTCPAAAAAAAAAGELQRVLR
jgi:hypothetical protein